PRARGPRRMSGDVEAEHLFLERQALIGLPLRHDLSGRDRPGGRGRRYHLAERSLPLGAVALLALAALERRVGRRQQMGAREAERVERARLDETLHDTPGQEPTI